MSSPGACPSHPREPATGTRRSPCRSVHSAPSATGYSPGLLDARVPLAVATVGVLLLGACSPPEVELPEPKPRPVEIMELRTIDPVKPLQVTGAVQSWKEQDVAFEVAGTLHSIVEPMTNLEGRWVESGDASSEQQVLVTGEVLARLSTQEYLIRRESARASVNVAKEKKDLAQVELDKVVPADIRAAQADRARAIAELTRIQKAVKSGAVSEIDEIRALAEMERAEAGLERAKAQVDSKKAEIEAAKASIDQAIAQLADAQYALERCTLYAPFSAQVADLLVEAGGYVQPGTPVAHIIMMDPIKVDLNVSPKTVESLGLGDVVSFRLSGSTKSHEGRIYEKAAIADPQTRTFRVSILTRNWQTIGGVPADDPIFSEYPVSPKVHVVAPLEAHRKDSPLVVLEGRNLLEDDAGWFVWANTEMSFPLPSPPLVPVHKVRVVPGEQRINFQGIVVGRVLKDPGTLKPGSLCPSNVPEGHAEGAPVLIGEPEWALLPGKLVSVLLDTDVPEPGIYVPIDVVRPASEDDGSGDLGEVFALDGGVARLVRVRRTGQILELVRIEAVDAAQASLIAPGRQLVADFVHFLRDGDAVKPTGTREITK